MEFDKILPGVDWKFGTTTRSIVISYPWISISRCHLLLALGGYTSTTEEHEALQEFDADTPFAPVVIGHIRLQISKV